MCLPKETVQHWGSLVRDFACVSAMYPRYLSCVEGL